MEDNKINEMLRVSKASIRALGLIDSTIEKVNEDALVEIAEILKVQEEVNTFGVKNTDQIGRRYIKRLVDTKKYVWHTIDTMAEGGRAIDINLINPITGKPMTGSSSATAINVLYSINDIGIGTDGGGSVLAPALSLNLISIMAKGMGLKGDTGKTSTDGISFVPGIGVMSQSFSKAKDCVYTMLDIDKEESLNLKDVKVLVCKEHNIELPDGSDMRIRLEKVVKRLAELQVEITEEEFPDFYDREKSITWALNKLKKYDMIITLEGPIDLMGFGDSVFGTLGDFAKSIQNQGGKYMIKIANMINATSITLPIDEVASGIVITAREGLKEGIKAIALAEGIKELYTLPELYHKYFQEAYKRKKNEILFSVKGV